MTGLLGAPIDDGENGNGGYSSPERGNSWPSPPAAGRENPPAAAAWPSPGGQPVSAGSPGDLSAARWPERAETAWPRPGSTAETHDAPAQASEHAAESFWRPRGAPSATAPNDDPAAGPTVADANRLLDELRQVLANLPPERRDDLSGVISDLEVAVTPPGALTADARAELREALLLARQRPRELDTAVDLSNRIDAIVALMFAYDRAIAAIERSLAVLRRDPSPMGNDNAPAAEVDPMPSAEG